MPFTSRFAVRAMSLAVAAVSTSLSIPATASMGNIGTTYGIVPVDAAKAAPLSMFNDPVSATYYNPAYLTKDGRGELTASFFHAEQELRSANPNANGDIWPPPPASM